MKDCESGTDINLCYFIDIMFYPCHVKRFDDPIPSPAAKGTGFAGYHVTRAPDADLLPREAFPHATQTAFSTFFGFLPMRSLIAGYFLIVLTGLCTIYSLEFPNGLS